MTREEEILNKAHQLAEKYFPESQNIWARPNIEAQKVKYACIEMAEWLEKAMIEKACEIAKDILNSYSFANYPHEMQDFLVDFRKAMEE